MDSLDLAPWFVGDLNDPWVAEIADALPPGTRRLVCAGDLPDDWPAGFDAARTLVIHRAHLTHADSERIRRLKEREGPPIRVVLCVGPQVRYREVERWSTLVDAILPEATARETVTRQLAVVGDLARSQEPRPKVTIVSGQYELRRMLEEVCAAAGYQFAAESDWPEAMPGGLVVWDVPILGDAWPEILERRSRGCQVVALIGFADRVSVRLARVSGAAACLDSPCDPADIAFVLDRLVRARGEGRPHAVPPAPRAIRRPRRDAVRAPGPVAEASRDA
jgi:hypothetical protein